VRVEDCGKRVRAVRDGQVVIDSLHTKYVWAEWPPYPSYYFPPDDVRLDLVDPDEVEEGPDGLVGVPWSTMDHWFEEDEEVWVHARDPYSRVDILVSHRTVRVDIDGVTVAESDQPRILFETRLPPRYYLPLTSVRMDLLRPSDHHTQCPYKGNASYWSVEVNGTLHENIAWTYPAPLAESLKIAGLVAFYNDRVDLSIDGVLQERPPSMERPPANS
jgi:uncharacterized protein (DUF427 family)